MRFKCNAPDLVEAIRVVSIVSPRPIGPKDTAGYLFVVRGEKCFVYSRDQYRVVRSSFTISDVEGEGAFVYPAEFTNAFKYLGDSITFEATDGTVEDYTVKYTSAGGDSVEHITVDPKLTTPCDREYDAATDAGTFFAPILREALSLSNNFIAKPTDLKAEEQTRTVQIFDRNRPEWAAGDGSMFATDTTQTFHFYCEAFKGKNLAVHSQNLSHLKHFLGTSQGEVSFRQGANYTFVDDGVGNLLGWTHTIKTHGKYAYIALKRDNYVFSIPKLVLMNKLQHIRNELPKQFNKIKVTLDPSGTIPEIKFNISESSTKGSLSMIAPLKVNDDGQPVTPVSEPFSVNVNIDRLMTIVQDVKGNEVELRVILVPGENGKPGPAYFRTIDDFRIDSAGKVSAELENTFQCRVTRFLPSY